MESNGIFKWRRRKLLPINSAYPVLIHLMTVLSGTLLLSLLFLFDKEYNIGFIIYFFIVITSTAGMFALPSLLVSYLFYFMVEKKMNDEFLFRLVYAFVNVLLALISVLLIGIFWWFGLTYVAFIFIWTFL